MDIKTNNVFTRFVIIVGSSASTTNLDAGATKIGEGEQSRQNGVVPSELPTRTAEGTCHIISGNILYRCYFFPLLVF